MTTNTAIPLNALNANDLTGLRREARGQNDQATKQVAQQFESLFVQTMLKRMRAASLGDGGIFSSAATKQYRGLFDQQMAMQASQGEGLGLATLIERQIRTQNGENSAAPALDKSLDRYWQSAPAAAVPIDRDAGRHGAAPTPTSSEASPAAGPETTPGRWNNPQAFVADILPAARRTADELGVSPRALVAQAALETGWGARTLRAADGSPSFNLFNIKAHGWQGARVRVPTLEYRDGVAVREQAAFRAYGSVDEAFADYADFLRDNPRYRDALNTGADDPAGFADALEAAGYATDPRYAEKLRRILDGPTLRASIAGLKDSAERTTT